MTGPQNTSWTTARRAVYPVGREQKVIPLEPGPRYCRRRRSKRRCQIHPGLGCSLAIYGRAITGRASISHRASADPGNDRHPTRCNDMLASAAIHQREPCFPVVCQHLPCRACPNLLACSASRRHGRSEAVNMSYVSLLVCSCEVSVPHLATSRTASG